MSITLTSTPDTRTAARTAARFIAQHAQAAIDERGHFTMALSGGSTPRPMLEQLANCELEWNKITAVQVDERIAPLDSGERNIQTLRETLGGVLSNTRILAMPVNEGTPDAAANAYEQQLEHVAGTPIILDLIHLGLGSDGHTASLVPNDDALKVNDRDVTASGLYQGRRRLTLTYPAINRARCILFYALGSAKKTMIERLLNGDITLPAGRINPSRTTLITDHAGHPPE